METINGVEIIDVGALLEEAYGAAWYEVDYAETGLFVRNWCRKNGAVYYAAEREDFSPYDAADKAKAAGLSRVVVEDLS